MDSHAITVAALYLCASVGLSLGAHTLAGVTPLPRPTTGLRGMAREQALRSGVFRLIEPVLRWLGALLSGLLPASLRQQARQIAKAGGHLAGLDGDELLALSLLSVWSASTLARLVGLSNGWFALATAAGLVLPVLQLREKALARQRDIARALPAAIDVMALAMGAGLGFAAALDLAAREAVDPTSDLGQELNRVRQAIATGHSRKTALEGLAERVPCETVRDFASAVIQGELKGTPLAGILEIQARTLRARRAVLAEEAAARASVLLVLPLLLLLCAVLLLMFGPFIVNGIGL